MASRSPSLSNQFQSALIEKAYKAVALSAICLMSSCCLWLIRISYVRILHGQRVRKILVITDLRLCVQCCAVSAKGKALGIMVLQDRTRWVTLANLTE